MITILTQSNSQGLEEKLARWTAPSSDSEQEKQERTERMIKQAIDAHVPFNDCALKVYAKGSYANNTNVRADSDVDIAVECTECEYWEEAQAGFHKPREQYSGIWTPDKLRSELASALRSKFPGQTDTTGSTAIKIAFGSSRIDADVVPCFSYRYYFESSTRKGTKVFKTNGASVVNYPAQQLEYGVSKNKRTGYAYKKCVRILKRAQNAMREAGIFRDLPSFFIESLAFNCPDSAFSHSTWTECLRDVLVYIWQELEGSEPDHNRWVEANDCLYLFHQGKKWFRQDGRDFAKVAWNYFGFN